MNEKQPQIFDDEVVDQPRPYHNGTQTSRCAADAVRPQVKKQAIRVHNYIVDCGNLGATDAEMQTVLGLSGDSQRPRRRWLEQHGYIKYASCCRMTENNRPAKVWIATGKMFEVA
ncbi:hypothetical protein OAH18_00550 [bacterium]|nr:hypothetical protein [bacterium]